jgi:hypothetical protein
MEEIKYEQEIINKFNKIKELFDTKKLLNNIIIKGNNSYLNNLYLDKLVEILFGKNPLKKIEGNINIYSCKYFIKFTAINIPNNQLIEVISEYIQCINLIYYNKIFIIYNLDSFNELNLKYLKNIIEKNKIIIIASSSNKIHNNFYYNITIKKKDNKEDIIKYNLYYNILEDFYKRINSENFISHTDQLSKQLNKYLYDFTFFIHICFDFFKNKCCKIKLIKLCSDSEHTIKISNTKTIYLSKLIFDILLLIEGEKIT